MKSELGDAAIDELKRAFKGAVWRPGDAGFVRHSQLFNATIRSPAQLLVRPLDVDDVSEVVRFCVKHDLSLSVKSGGYGTHGWAVEGDVVVDMRLIAQITIERPMEHSQGQDWVSMRESPHIAVKDPDSLKGKARVPSANAYPTSYPSAGVGPQPIHAPFGDSPYRRSADEAFDNVVVVPPDGMDADDRSDPDSDRPTRRLRISSPASHASHASNTPPTTDSPHTPADGSEPKPSNTPKPFSFDDPPSKAIPSTREDVEHDEGMLPPTADRPGAGVDIRGYVGRDVGGWDTVWTGTSDGAAAESVGATYAVTMGDTTNPPVLPPRSTAPLSARPFDFGEASPAMQVNALANPHGNPSLGARPFQLPRSNSGSNSDYSTPGPESEQPAPTVTHVAFEPTAPVPYTYVTFGAGASQKDVDAFCAAHPLAAVTPGNLADGVDGVDGVGGVDGDGHSSDQDDKPAKKPTIVADSSQPGLYQTPQGSGFGPGSGSFFAPGVGIAAGGAHGYGSVGFGQPSTFASPGHSFFGQPPNPIFGNASTTPTIPYHVPFAAHPVGSTVMLLGGFGFLSRLRGLSMDCLVEAEVVLADGRVVWVSKGGVRDRDGNEVEVDDDPELDEVAKEFVEAEKERAKRAKEKERASDDESDGEFVSDEKPQVDGKAEEEPVKKGLWWALRGAGSAFGIVVRYKARAFPIPVVFAGNLIYNFNKSTAASLIKHFRDCIKAAPRELYANCILTSGPKGRGALIVIQICYAGSRADGLPFLQAISSWDVEPCLLNEVQEKEFVWQQDSIAKVLKGGSGRKWFIRSDLISSLTDEIIHRTVRKFSDTPDGCTWLFELSGGALTDTTDSCLPKKAREAAFTIVALHQWRLELDDPACVLTAEQWIKDTLMPQSTGGPFPCFLERRERRSRILGVYGPENWARLCALKKKYDPTGLFKHNFWPLDEHGRPVLDPREMRNGADVTSGHVMDETLDDRGVPI